MTEDEQATTTTTSTSTSTSTATSTATSTSTSTTTTTSTSAAAAAAKGGHKNVVHWQEVQDTVSRLASHKGVLAVSILNADGDIVTQHVTTAGVARSKSNAASSSTSTSDGASGASAVAPAVVGNPKLLTRMMAAANLYVQSLSGKDRVNGGASMSDATTSNDEAAAGEAANDQGDDESSSNGNNNKEEEISFVRIRTQKDEILVAPKLGYTLVVLQDPRMSSL